MGWNAVKDIEDLADAVCQAAEMVLAFGRVERRPYYPDETRRESDTDHTVMLGLVAPALADMLYPGELNVGLIAQFCIVHDLAEVYAGDVATLRTLPPDVADAKKAAETAAVLRISEEFGASLPWVPRVLRQYEDQQLPEARFVRAVDKLLPKAVALLEVTMRSVREQVVSADEHDAHMGPNGGQARDLNGYALDWPEVLQVRNELANRLTARLREHEAALA